MCLRYICDLKVNSRIGSHPISRTFWSYRIQRSKVVESYRRIKIYLEGHSWESNPNLGFRLSEWSNSTSVSRTSRDCSLHGYLDLLYLSNLSRIYITASGILIFCSRQDLGCGYYLYKNISLVEEFRRLKVCLPVTTHVRVSLYRFHKKGNECCL